MNSVNYLIPAAIATFSLAGAVGANAEDRFHEPNRYAATNLVSDLAGKAKVRDPILQNAWGVAFSPAPSPVWISDNATGCSTLYDGDGTIVALQVKIPLPGAKCQLQPVNMPTRRPRPPQRRSASFGTQRRNSWSRERSYRLHSSLTPRTERFPPGPAA
jgi:hypothetical protein